MKFKNINYDKLLHKFLFFEWMNSIQTIQYHSLMEVKSLNWTIGDAKFFLTANFSAKKERKCLSSTATRGTEDDRCTVKEPCSTSIIRWLHCPFFSRSLALKDLFIV